MIDEKSANDKNQNLGNFFRRNKNQLIVTQSFQ